MCNNFKKTIKFENQEVNNIKDCEKFMDNFVEWLKSQPQPKFKILNTDKYFLIIQLAYELKRILAEAIPCGEINVTVDEDFNHGAITIELGDLTVYDTKTFAGIIALADNIEVYPLTSGKIRLDLTFQAVLKGVYAEEE